MDEVSGYANCNSTQREGALLEKQNHVSSSDLHYRAQFVVLLIYIRVTPGINM